MQIQRIDYKGVCDRGFSWNPSNYECECNKHVTLVNIWTMKIVNAGKN